MATEKENNVNGNGWRRKSDVDILHAAKGIIQCEISLNHEVTKIRRLGDDLNSQVDKLLGLIGLTREEVCKGVEEVKDDKK